MNTQISTSANSTGAFNNSTDFPVTTLWDILQGHKDYVRIHHELTTHLEAGKLISFGIESMLEDDLDVTSDQVMTLTDTVQLAIDRDRELRQFLEVFLRGIPAQ